MEIFRYLTNCQEVWIWKCLSMVSRNVGVSKEKLQIARHNQV